MVSRDTCAYTEQPSSTVVVLCYNQDLVEMTGLRSDHWPPH